MARAFNLDIDLTLALDRFTSHPVLHALGDLLVTGLPGNNLPDLRILFSDSSLYLISKGAPTCL